MLVAALPRDSATSLAVNGGDARWTLTDHLLAGVIDTLNGISWQLGGGKGPRPKPVPRPGTRPDVERHGRTTRPPAQVVAYLRRFGPRSEGGDSDANGS